MAGGTQVSQTVVVESRDTWTRWIRRKLGGVLHGFPKMPTKTRNFTE